jgi:hypothetical protein
MVFVDQQLDRCWVRMGAVPMAEFWMPARIPLAVYAVAPGLVVLGAASAGASIVDLVHTLPKLFRAPAWYRKISQDQDQFAVRCIGVFAASFVALLPAILSPYYWSLFYASSFGTLIQWIRSHSQWSAIPAHGIIWNSWIGERFRLVLVDAH